MRPICRHMAHLLPGALLGVLLAGCAGTPAPHPPATAPAAQPTPAARVAPLPPQGHENAIGFKALSVARDLLGTPYRSGGTTPRGFDCSGLVQYAFGQVGRQIPRSSADQFRASALIPPNALQPGDLVFFRISQQKVSHVGIYAGQGRFIHAPSSGKGVSYANLADSYWRQRLVGAGRF